MTSLGLPPDVAADLVSDIFVKGPFLEQIGVDAPVVDLIRSLHSCSWFSYGSLTSAIVTRTGGRQGCKLGDLVFNLVYERALRDVRQQLREAGIIASVPLAQSCPFWCSDHHPDILAPVWDSDHDGTHRAELFDATYVDDEAIFMCARSAKNLDRSIDVALSILIKVFNRFHLNINWARGKSEAMLKYVAPLFV